MADTANHVSRTCFIVASTNADLAPIRQVLASRAIDCITVGEIAEIGGSITSLISVIEDVDFVCVIFTQDETSTNTIFEAGIAFGLRKPTIILKGDIVRLPFDFAAIGLAPFSVSNVSALETHLGAFLRTLPSRQAHRKVRKVRSEKEKDIRWAYEHLDAFKKDLQTSPSEFEKFIMDLFRHWRYSVTAAPVKEFGADMALWSLDLKRKLGNPVLVEIKLSDRDRTITDQVVKRLSNMIRAGQGSIGLVVVPTGRAKAIQSLSREAPVFLFTADELIQSLSADSFLELLASRREDFLKRKT